MDTTSGSRLPARRIRNPETGLVEDIVCASRDISDRKAVEDTAQEQHTLADALSDAASLLKRSLKTDETLSGILEQAARVVPYDSASIGLIDGDVVRVVGCRGFAERGLEEMALSTIFRISERPDFYDPLIEKKQPLIIEDVHEYPNWVTPPGTEWIHGNLSVPVIVQDKVIGLFHLDSSEPGAFTREQARHLQMFADQVAIAIQSAQLYDELRALYHATSFLFASFDADDLVDLANQITQVVVQEFGKVDCGLVLLEPETGQIPLLVRAGEYRIQTNVPIHRDGPGLIAASLRTSASIYAPHVSQDARYLNADDRTQSELVIPLMVGGTVIGALDLQSPMADAFTEQDQRILRAYADRAAVAIQNLQYSHELELRVVERTTELRRTKEHVEAILNNSSDAIIVTNINGTIYQVNPAFSTLFGYPAQESLDKPLMDLVTEDDRKLLGIALNSAIMDSRPGRIEIALCRKDNVRFDADVVISPILENDQHSLGVVCTVRDITERKHMEMELRKALEQERELSELKTRFVSMASHEFRTPLTMIMTASELLQNYHERMTDEQRVRTLKAYPDGSPKYGTPDR